MKIFISYSRRDADFAQQIDEYFQGSGHDVFTDVKNIQVGVVWTSAIENNISNCDIFVVIITHAALRSTEIEKEVLQAQREKKKIIPCIHRDVSYDEIKWNLKSLQGVEFQDKYELSRVLYSKIAGKRPPPSPSRQKDDYTTRQQGLSLKIIMPIVAVIGIVGIILAFTIFSGIGGSNNNNIIPPPSTDYSSFTNNNPPVALDDSSITTRINQPVNVQLLGTDKDSNEDLTATIVTTPTNGKLGNINQATGIVTYTPNSDFRGTDNFTFKVNDGKVDSNNIGKILITVN
jgi:hypothetical protein